MKMYCIRQKKFTNNITGNEKYEFLNDREFVITDNCIECGCKINFLVSKKFLNKFIEILGSSYGDSLVELIKLYQKRLINDIKQKN